MSRRLRVELLGDHPRLRRPHGIALLLPGGDVSSQRSLPRWDVSVARMRMFSGAIEALSAGRIAPLTLKYRHPGWNAPRLDAVHDARAVLRYLALREPRTPIVLVGHSMGGRVALRVADHPAVAGVCLLAPWVEADDGPERVGPRPLLVVHAPSDIATDPDASAALVERARALGTPAEYRSMPFDNHPMLLRAAEWHAITARFVQRCVMGAAVSPSV